MLTFGVRHKRPVNTDDPAGSLSFSVALNKCAPYMPRRCYLEPANGAATGGALTRGRLAYASFRALVSLVAPANPRLSLFPSLVALYIWTYNSMAGPRNTNLPTPSPHIAHFLSSLFLFRCYSCKSLL